MKKDVTKERKTYHYPPVKREPPGSKGLEVLLQRVLPGITEVRVEDLTGYTRGISREDT